MDMYTFVAAVPDYYVGVYECVCGCVRALGFRHHQDWWVCPAWRRATPEEDDHTHTCSGSSLVMGPF